MPLGIGDVVATACPGAQCGCSPCGVFACASGVPFYSPPRCLRRRVMSGGALETTYIGVLCQRASCQQSCLSGALRPGLRFPLLYKPCGIFLRLPTSRRWADVFGRSAERRPCVYLPTIYAKAFSVRIILFAVGGCYISTLPGNILRIVVNIYACACHA